MPHLRFARRYAYYRDDVEPQFLRRVVGFDVGVGGQCQIAYLLLVYRLLGFFHIVGLTRLYLYKHYGAVVFGQCDDVEVAPALSPVSFADDVALLLQEARGGVLSPLTQFVVLCHTVSVVSKRIDYYSFIEAAYILLCKNTIFLANLKLFMYFCDLKEAKIYGRD